MPTINVVISPQATGRRTLNDVVSEMARTSTARMTILATQGTPGRP
jgi:hypothetical protein